MDAAGEDRRHDRGGARMIKRGWIGALATTLALVALVASTTATAAKPTFQRINIDETAPDEFLTEACGVAVTTRARGHIIVRTFGGGKTGVAEVTTINVALAATAGGNTYRFRDVGADVTRIEPDGTMILMIIGQLPFDFTGVLKIDLETGDAILVPQHSIEERLDEACAVLTA
jgi:hypothetical protein